MKHKAAILGLVAIMLVGILSLAATTDRATGGRENYTCSIDIVANNDALDFCSFAMPQAAVLENVQAYCETVTSDPQITIDTPSGDTYVAAVNLAASGVILQPTIADTTVVDEAIVDILITADAGDAATDCTVMLTWYRQ